MKNSMLGLLLGLCAAGMVQAQEVVDKMTIQVGAGLMDGYMPYKAWGYSADSEFPLGSLVLPAPGVEILVVAGNEYQFENGDQLCAEGLAVNGDGPEQVKYLRSIVALKYGDIKLDIKNADNSDVSFYVMPDDGRTGLGLLGSCGFFRAVEAAYPDGSIVNIAITREVADPLPPVIVPATLGVDFSLRAGYPNQVPAIGGAIRHSCTLSNLGVTGKPILYWITTRVPGGSDYPLLTPRSVTVAAGTSFSELKTFPVPAWFPAGSYSARLVMVDPATGERVTADIPFSKAAN